MIKGEINMLKNKKILLTILLVLLLILLPNMVKAAVNVTRNVYSNNGSMKFTFTGLTLDTTHEYEFGLKKTSGAEITKWTLITEYDANSAVVDVKTTVAYLRDVVNATDKGYITIRDKNTTQVVVESQEANFKLPYLRMSNHPVLINGKNLINENNLQIASKNAQYYAAYYTYEKITDQNLINKYKEIKSNNGSYLQLESFIESKNIPDSNWNMWRYFNGYGDLVADVGYGYPQREVAAPGSGLYYMWLYFAGKGVKDAYGVILVDNLQKDVALESISLPSTKEVALGKSLTLSVTYNPVGATNKIVTWSSSDESVATVDNAGKITPKKLGSTIITAISQDGNKKATCTVTVIQQASNVSGKGENNNPGSDNKNPSTPKNENVKKDETIAPGEMPYTGGTFFIVLAVLGITVVAIYVYKRNNDLKGI